MGGGGRHVRATLLRLTSRRCMTSPYVKPTLTVQLCFETAKLALSATGSPTTKQNYSCDCHMCLLCSKLQKADSELMLTNQREPQLVLWNCTTIKPNYFDRTLFRR